MVRRAVESYPRSFLFADEVGLGKTLEAGLALRQLWIAERVRRVLILVPRAVLRQWQEELREKVALDVPRLEGTRVLDVFDREIEGDRVEGADPGAANLWDRHPILLASSQTARSTRRRDEILSAKPWDLVIVDEAHHARRRQARLDTFRPNRLLELLVGPARSGRGGRDGRDGRREGLADRARCLYLLTATPMQVHPVEVWDLLRLLGLGGRWGARPEAFVSYFEELRRPFAARDWRFMLSLLADSLEAGEIPGEIPGAIPEALKPVVEPTLRGDLDAAAEAARALDDEARARLDALLRRSTPVETLVFRHTRERLRRYRREGRLALDVPEREPRNVWIELSREERALYRRIEAYLARFYQRYEARRTGLGFVMTVYRRRLTSSFAAVRRSLERRREWLLGRMATPSDLLDVEDLPEEGAIEEGSIEGEQADLFDAFESVAFDGIETGSETGGDEALPAASPASRDELEHLDAFLDALEALDGDSKLDRLRADIDEILDERDRVIVFTQYTDTMDHLRDRLGPTAEPVVCYSGRGGERRGAEGWTAWEKEALKDAFGRGEIRVLLCTEAASEGLNLQTCGVLLNYDMPWNPMRVEQRIGRIDRLGQRHATVWIRNYFYADTVEATIYQRLADRIDWFRAVVGELQPILHRVEETLGHLALLPEDRREKPLEEELARLRGTLDDAPPDPLADDSAEGSAELDATLRAVPATPDEVEAVVLASSLGEKFSATGEEGIFRLDDERGERAVTFRPEIYADRPYSLDLLAWGAPRFEALLGGVSDPKTTDDPAGVGLYRSWNPAPVSLFLAPASGKPGDENEVTAATDLRSLDRLLEAPVRPWRAAAEGAASALFSRRRSRMLRETTKVEAERRRAARRALRVDAAETLVTAAAVELVRAENPGLFDAPLGFGWGAAAIRAQARHGEPFERLLALVPGDLVVAPDDPIAAELRGLSPGMLDRRFAESAARGVEVAVRWRTLDAAEEAERRAAREPSAGGLLERTFFLPRAIETPAGPPRLAVESVEPFVDAVPVFDDLAEIVRALADAREEGRDLLAELAADPHAAEWVASATFARGETDRFAAPLPDSSGGEVAVFRLETRRLETRPPREGTPVVVAHPGLDGGVGHGDWRLEDIWEDGHLEGRRLVLDTAEGSLVVEDPEELRLVAILVEVVG